MPIPINLISRRGEELKNLIEPNVVDALETFLLLRKVKIFQDMLQR